MLDGQIDLFPVHVNGNGGFHLHAARVLTGVAGAVDFSRSDCNVNKIAGSVSSVRTLCLDPSRIPEPHLFKLYETRYLHTYVSEAFIDAVASAGLLGFGCREVRLV